MARLIYFSTNFPKYHPKAGQETHFIEGIWISLLWLGIDPTPPWNLLLEKEEEYLQKINRSYAPKQGSPVKTPGYKKLHQWFSMSPDYKKKKAFEGQIIAWHEVQYDLPF